MGRVLVLGSLVAALMAAAPASGQETRPNVLIIQTDDQNASEDGYAAMDATMRVWRAGGTEYPNAIATTPVCCPSRATTFTGRYAHNHGVTKFNPGALNQTTTVQNQLRQRGFLTAHVGKYLNNWTGRPPDFDYVGGRTGYYKNGTYGTTVNRNAALTFLGRLEQQDESPWLMFVNVSAPHDPAVPETKYKDAPVPPYAENPARVEDDLRDKPAYVQGWMDRWSVTTEGIKGFRARQIRTLYSVDDLVESVFTRMEELGEQNTIAFFISDNGYMWNEHTLDRKRHLYGESLEIPFFVRWPGHIPEGVRNPRLTGNIDIAPTIYEATGVTPTNYRPDGRSLLSPHDRRFLLGEHWSGSGVPTWKGLWSPSEVFARYADGFREYYGFDDAWQLGNVFRDGVSGNEPANQAELEELLTQQSTCRATGCL